MKNNKSTLGSMNLEFASNVSTKELLNKYNGVAVITLHSSDGESSIELHVDDYNYNVLREFNNDDDADGGEITMLGGIRLNELMCIILDSVKKGDYLKQSDFEDLLKEDYNQAVDFIVSDELVKNGVVERGGIGGGIVYANLANATITKKGIDFLEEHKCN